MDKKDYFSGHSKVYAAFRPTYPRDMFDFIFQHVENRSAAWDCGTGNGQVAQYLASHFDSVYATDTSQQPSLFPFGFLIAKSTSLNM